jgi:hypothetical protein
VERSSLPVSSPAAPSASVLSRATTSADTRSSPGSACFARIRRLRGRREESSQARSTTRVGWRVQEILHNIPQRLA